MSQDDINRGLSSSDEYNQSFKPYFELHARDNQFYDYAVNESSLGYSSDFSDNEAPDFTKYYQNLIGDSDRESLLSLNEDWHGEPHVPILMDLE